MLARGVCLAVETGDKLVAVELELKEFGKGEEERAVRHLLVGCTLRGK